ncbi:hypothetical protein NEOLEDRAFT_1073838, partial [Neolentinus lepideus HHB14362 ss-1]
TKKFGGGSLMVWACVTGEVVGWICRINGIMTGPRYVEILDTHLCQTLNDYRMKPRHYFFQQDNDTKHCS